MPIINQVHFNAAHSAVGPFEEGSIGYQALVNNT
jgi:hypothetical protein